MRAWRVVGYVTGGLVALVLAGCAAMTVSSYVEQGADFTRYRTYNWAPDDQLSTGDPRLDNNPFFQAQVRQSVEGELARRGYAKATSAPDVIVHYHANVTDTVDASAIDREAGYCDENSCRPFVYEAGTLVLDLVDARTERLVWRGWAKDTFDGIIENQDWMEERIGEAVAKIMERLPRTLS